MNYQEDIQTYPLRLTHRVRINGEVEVDILQGDNVRVTAGRGKRACAYIPLNLVAKSISPADVEKRFTFSAFTISSDVDENDLSTIDEEGCNVIKIKSVSGDTCCLDLKLFHRGLFVSVIVSVEDALTKKTFYFISNIFNAHNNGKERSVAERLRLAKKKEEKQAQAASSRPGKRKRTQTSDESTIMYKRQRARLGSAQQQQEQGQQQGQFHDIVAVDQVMLPPPPNYVRGIASDLVQSSSLQQQQVVEFPSSTPSFVALDATTFHPYDQKQEITTFPVGQGTFPDSFAPMDDNDDLSLILELGDMLQEDPGFAHDFVHSLDVESTNNGNSDVAALSWGQFPYVMSSDRAPSPLIRSDSQTWSRQGTPLQNHFLTPIMVGDQSSSSSLFFENQ